ncbi:CLK4-associating serine/arginine rich protein isoform X2 [Hydra vulgaris]|uniref:CLK4-associating serine/arginine rich protein isoform X2 n=1 Tax=Hydra vulgaris TaxID=6087 RepID=A0ABM4C1C6_HYDVU
MWQEARKQEKKLRGIMIDYKKRAERRQAYYTKMKMDPHQLIRVYGQKCKFHMLNDSSVAIADGQLMPWQGDNEILIDRFDVRAHLDFIPEPVDCTEETDEDKLIWKCNYESYRTLVQIDATGASEEQYLKQLEIEEAYGKKQAEQKLNVEKEKAQSKANAKIHYKYEGCAVYSNDEDSTSEESESDLSDIDINVNVLELEEEQQNHLDALATQYGIGYGQYCKQLLFEKKEFEYVKKLEEEEEQRSKMPGRKGKSARRSLRMKQKTMRGSPLSFALQEKEIENDPDGDGCDRSSSSRSPSPHTEEKIEYITEFGGATTNTNKETRKENEQECNAKINKQKHSNIEDRDRHRSRSHDKKKSRSHDRRSSRSRDRRRSRSRNRYRSPSHEKYQSRSQGRHRSKSNERYSSKSRQSSHKSRSRSRSRSYSKRSNQKRSRSRSNERKHDDRLRRTKSKSKSPLRRDNIIDRGLRKISPKHLEISHSISPQRIGGLVPKQPMASQAKTNIDKSKLTPREKMKLRMQKLLSKQIKNDKKVELKKQAQKEMLIEEREMEIFQMSRMMKLKERERRQRRSVSPRGRTVENHQDRSSSRSESPE